MTLWWLPTGCPSICTMTIMVRRCGRPAPGGLVAALTPVLAQHHGCWIGWPGTTTEAPEPFRTESGILLNPVSLSQSDYEEFYEGFANATLWPLYHDLIVTPQVSP